MVYSIITLNGSHEDIKNVMLCGFSSISYSALMGVAINFVYTMLVALTEFTSFNT